MPSFNKVLLVGNLTRDPELRYTPKGTAVAKIGLAVNRKWKTEAGEEREEVTFVDVDSFGRQAETMGQYLRKGSPLLVEGRLKLDQWDDKQTGQKRSRLGVVCESFQFLGGKQEGTGAPRQQPKADPINNPADWPTGTATTQSSEEPPMPADDSVPF